MLLSPAPTPDGAIKILKCVKPKTVLCPIHCHNLDMFVTRKSQFFFHLFGTPMQVFFSTAI